jgi:hypothetical protein
MKRIYAAILVAVIASLAGLIYWGIQLKFTRADWPAWVQAVGSIAAIIGAYWVSGIQIKADTVAAVEAEARAQRRQRGSILAIAKAAIEVVDVLPKAADHNLQGRLAVSILYDKRVFEGFINALEAVPIHELGSARAVTALLGLKNGLIAIQVAAEKFFAQSMGAENLYPSSRPDPAKKLSIGHRIASVQAAYEQLSIELSC